MMKINRVNFILLIFIYFLNINHNSFIKSSTASRIINNVFQIDDITQNRITDSYPTTATSNNCNFQFDILASCVNDNGNNGPPSLLLEMNSIISNSYNLTKLSNSTSRLYSLLYSVYTTSSRVTTDITLAGCGYTGTESSVYQLSFQCHEVDVQSLTVEMSQIYYTFNFQYHSILKITGLLYPLSLSTNYLYSLGDGYYYYSLSGYTRETSVDFYDTFKINNFTLSMMIGTQEFKFSIAPFQSLSSVNEIRDYKNYPSDLNQTHLFNQNYKCSPISTFKVKSNDPFPPMIFKVNNKSYNLFQYIFMYGERDGSLVYYNLLDSLFSTTKPNIDLYFFAQQGDHFEKASNVSFTMTQITFYALVFTLETIDVKNNLVFSFTTSDTKYEFLPFFFIYNTKYLMNPFPFGFEFGTLNSFNFEVNYLYSGLSISFNYGSYDGSYNYKSYTNLVNSGASTPIVNDISIRYISDLYYSVVIHLSDSDYGISRITIGLSNFGFESLISGTIFDGIFECIVPAVTGTFDIIYVFDTNLNQLQFSAQSYYSINPVKYFGTLKSNFSIDSISSITLDSYEMDITDTDSYNTMYFDFFGKKINYTFFVIFPIDLLLSDATSGDAARWDDVKKVYYVKFKLLKNSAPTRNLEWSLLTIPERLTIQSTAFIDKFPQECIVKSLTPDLSGPFVTNIVKIPDSGIADLNIDPLQAVGWNITIEDKVNGFSHGFIVAQGLVDGSIYNFTLNSNNSEKSITFTLLLSNISCIDQDFQINQIELYDTVGMVSGYNFYNRPTIYTFNALMNYNNELDILRISIACKPLIIDTSGPELISITPNRTSIDVGSNDRSISFTLIVRDSDSGINIGQSPIVYLTSYGMDTKIECKSKLISCDNSDEKQCTFKCDIELPFTYGFGFSNQFIYQVYGIWNKNGLFSGYSYNKLYSLGIDSVIKTSFSTNIPIITKTSKVSNEPNSEILIIGRSIGNATSINIKYHDGTNESLIPICESQSYCIITIKGTNESFTIQIQLKDKSLSNIYKITPFIVGKFEYINSGSTNSISSSSSSSSSSTEITCPGQPVCGGTSNGYCTSKGCICISPWYGIECRQKIIIVPQPSFNNTDPNITIILPNENNNNQIEFTSLTSIIALRELDINNKVNQTHTFSKWYNNQINSTLNEYYSNFSNINNSDKTTQIKVTIQWFNNQTNITFADNELIMNPNSIKYTIEIKDYPFKSKLNSLEIVMSALFKSDKINSCSNKEFGESNGYDDSNYLKLQVNDHSLYARFIKRGIIDNNKIVSVSNRLLDSSFSTINEASTTQSYIGISIQHFENIAIVDPDFSIMLDFSKSSNSICKSTKLTSTQIAGIIIGCFGFAVVIAISFIVYYIKKKRNAREMKNLSNKLKNLS